MHPQEPEDVFPEKATFLASYLYGIVLAFDECTLRLPRNPPRPAQALRRGPRHGHIRQGARQRLLRDHGDDWAARDHGRRGRSPFISSTFLDGSGRPCCRIEERWR